MSERDERGMEASRAIAQWFLGDPGWADNLIDAYFDPEWAEKRLAEAKS